MTSRRLIDWAAHATPDEIVRQYGRAKHCLDQGIINWLWHQGNRDASTILGLLRATLTSDKSQILRDYEKKGTRGAEQRIRRMLLNAERSDAQDANAVLSNGRELQLLSIEYLSIHERAIFGECVRRAVAARGTFTFSVRDGMIAATCNYRQSRDAINTLHRNGFIMLRREHVKARKWARRWSLGDAQALKLGGQFCITASPYGGRGGSDTKITRAVVSIDPEIASAIYAQIGTQAHDMHMMLCVFTNGATISAYAKAINKGRVTARKWLARLSEFKLAEKRGLLWHAIQPDIVKWRELYDAVNGVAARQRIMGQVEEQRAAFAIVAARMDERELFDAQVEELMSSGKYKIRREAFRAARSARLAKQRPQPTRHEHFESKARELINT